MMLINTSTSTYHPILYFEKMFAGGAEADGNRNLIRYKSKGHRTVGFVNRQDAINSIELEMTAKVKELGYRVNLELEGDLEWDGTDIPADVQLRSRLDIVNH